MDMKRLKKQMDFILEIDKEKNIKRQTLITDASRQETDAEHAWHLAVMCALLSEYSNEKIDVPSIPIWFGRRFVTGMHTM